MSQQFFSVIFEGRVEDGMDPAAVEQRLSYHGLLSTEDIDDLRAGKPAVLVSGVTEDRALQYKATLEVAGARSRVVPSQEEPTSETASPHSATVELPVESSPEDPSPELAVPDLGTPDLGSPDPAGPVFSLPDLGTSDLGVPDLTGLDDHPAAAEPATSDARMTCPKCGFEQPESPECGACGIVISKFLQRQGRDRNTPT